MKKLVTMFLAVALCMGLAVPALAADGYEEVTIEYADFFGSGTMAQVKLDQAKAVTASGGSVSHYEVPAQVQVTVTLYERSSEQYQIALRWFNAEFYENGGSSAQTDVAYALLSPAGELTEYTSWPNREDYQSHQLLPNQPYTFTIQADRSDAVILECGERNDLFLMKGIQLRYAGGASGAEESGGSQDSGNPFTDVAANAYYADAVKWALDKGVITGTTATTFSPNTTCTTAQVITFLWRAFGSLSLSDDNPFTDVDETAYYADAALWASRNGLVSGSTFDGDSPCTRAATVTYLWKLAGMPAAGSADFADVAADAEYAQAVAWAVQEGVTTGTSATAFSPDTTCTRGQIVTFLYRDLAQ